MFAAFVPFGIVVLDILIYYFLTIFHSVTYGRPYSGNWLSISALYILRVIVSEMFSPFPSWVWGYFSVSVTAVVVMCLKCLALYYVFIKTLQHLWIETSFSRHTPWVSM